MATKNFDQFSDGDEYFSLNGDFSDLEDFTFDGMDGGTPGGSSPSFFKNVAKSAKNFAVAAGEKFTPDLMDLGRSIKDAKNAGTLAAADAKERIIDAAVKARNKHQGSAAIDPKAIAKELYSTGMDRLKKGKWFNDPNEIEFDMGGDDDWGDEEEGSDEEPEAKRKAKAKVRRPKYKPVKMKMSSLTAEQLMEVENQQTIASTKVQYGIYKREALRAEQHFTAQINVMKNIAVNVQLIAKIMSKEGIKSIMSGFEYQKKSIAFMQDQTALLKEMRNIQIRMAGGKKKTDKGFGQSRFERIAGMGFSGEEFIKNAKGNVREMFDNSMAGQLVGMMKMQQEMQGMMGGGKQGPASKVAGFLKMGGGMLGEAMLPPQLKAMLENVNKASSALPALFMSKLGSLAENGSGPMQLIGQILGVKNYEARGISTGLKDPRKPMPFDAQAHKALVAVIPGYLSKITAALTGGEETYFDYSSGKYKTNASLRQESKRLTRETLYQSQEISSVRDTITSSVAAKNAKSRNRVSDADITEGIDTFMENMVRGHIEMNPQLIANRREEIFQNVDPTVSNLILDMMQDPKASVQLKSQFMMYNSVKDKTAIDIARGQKVLGKTAMMSGGEIAYAQLNSENRNQDLQNQIRMEERKLQAMQSGGMDRASILPGHTAATMLLNQKQMVAQLKQQAKFDTENFGVVKEIGSKSTLGVGSSVSFETPAQGMESIYKLLLNGIIVYSQPLSKGAKQYLMGATKQQQMKSLQIQQEKEEERVLASQAVNDSIQLNASMLQQRREEFLNRGSNFLGGITDPFSTMVNKGLDKLGLNFMGIETAGGPTPTSEFGQNFDNTVNNMQNQIQMAQDQLAEETNPLKKAMLQAKIFALTQSSRVANSMAGQAVGHFDSTKVGNTMQDKFKGWYNAGKSKVNDVANERFGEEKVKSFKENVSEKFSAARDYMRDQFSGGEVDMEAYEEYKKNNKMSARQKKLEAAEEAALNNLTPQGVKFKGNSRLAIKSGIIDGIREAFGGRGRGRVNADEGETNGFAALQDPLNIMKASLEPMPGLVSSIDSKMDSVIAAINEVARISAAHGSGSGAIPPNILRNMEKEHTKQLRTLQRAGAQKSGMLGKMFGVIKGGVGTIGGAAIGLGKGALSLGSSVITGGLKIIPGLMKSGVSLATSVLKGGVGLAGSAVGAAGKALPGILSAGKGIIGTGFAGIKGLLGAGLGLVPGLLKGAGALGKGALNVAGGIGRGATGLLSHLPLLGGLFAGANHLLGGKVEHKRKGKDDNVREGSYADQQMDKAEEAKAKAEKEEKLSAKDFRKAQKMMPVNIDKMYKMMKAWDKKGIATNKGSGDGSMGGTLKKLGTTLASLGATVALAWGVKEVGDNIKAKGEIAGKQMGKDSNMLDRGKFLWGGSSDNYDAQGNALTADQKKGAQMGLKNLLSIPGTMKVTGFLGKVMSKGPVGIKQLGKLVVKSSAKISQGFMKVAAKAGSKAGGLLVKIKGLLTKVLCKGPLAKKIGTKAGPKIVSSLMAKIGKSSLGKFASKIAGKIAQIGTPVIGWAIFIAQVLADFTAGASSADRYFKLGKGIEPTAGMRIVSGLVNVISGILFGIIPTDVVVNLLWKIIGGKSNAELDKGREFVNKRAQILGVEGARLTEYESVPWYERIFAGKKKYAGMLGFGVTPEGQENYEAWKENVYQPNMELFKSLAEPYGGEGQMSKVLEDPEMQEKQTKFREAYLTQSKAMITSGKLNKYFPGSSGAETSEPAQSSTPTGVTGADEASTPPVSPGAITPSGSNIPNSITMNGMTASSYTTSTRNTSPSGPSYGSQVATRAAESGAGTTDAHTAAVPAVQQKKNIFETKDEELDINEITAKYTFMTFGEVAKIGALMIAEREGGPGGKKGGILGKLGDALKGVFGGAMEGLGNIGSNIAAGASAAGNWIADKANSVKEFLGNAASSVGQGIAGSLGAVAKWVGAPGQSLIEGVPVLLSRAGQKRKESAEAFNNFITNRFRKPGDPDAYITQRFGRYTDGKRHRGMDIGNGNNPNALNYAIEDGTVVRSQYGFGPEANAGGMAWKQAHNSQLNPIYSGMQGFGNAVTIKTDSGNYLIYGHQEYNAVKEGDKVRAGQVVGKMGNTGNSDGKHLHLQVRGPDNKDHDIAEYLNTGRLSAAAYDSTEHPMIQPFRPPANMEEKMGNAVPSSGNTSSRQPGSSILAPQAGGGRERGGAEMPNYTGESEDYREMKKLADGKWFYEYGRFNRKKYSRGRITLKPNKDILLEDERRDGTSNEVTRQIMHPDGTVSIENAISDIQRSREKGGGEGDSSNHAIVAQYEAKKANQNNSSETTGTLTSPPGVKNAVDFNSEIKVGLTILNQIYTEQIRHNKVSEEFFVSAIGALVAVAGGNSSLASKLSANISQPSNYGELALGR
jgi:murein DD-endopeptidase MepM/ murein hydrolase activator NlpD